MTDGEKVIEFITRYCLVPEGAKVGKPIRLEGFQKKFILDVYDNPEKTKTAILSIARKNGKTATIAAILLAHIIGPMRQLNSQIISGSNSRDQAALVYHLAEKMLNLQPKFAGLYRCVPSKKTIIGTKANVEYRAISADRTTAHGLSPILALLDEMGQVIGPTTPFIEAITTSQGAHDNPLLIILSTQAPSDSDFLSLQIDAAIRTGDPHTVCHVYAADADCDLFDEEQWKKANPALDIFRSRADLVTQLKKAKEIPALEGSARNLLLNQRISLNSLWLAPSVWKSNSGSPDLEVFQKATSVSLGLDLSMRNDLTAAVISTKDEEEYYHVIPFVFTPTEGIKARELRDKAPYGAWVDSGHLIAVPGTTLDYEWVCEYLKQKLNEMGIKLSAICFDRWRIDILKGAAQRTNFAQDAEWVEVAQGYISMSPRIEHFETILLQGRMRHGGHPLLNMAAANAVVIRDPANNRKIDKSKTTQRIDPLVAAVMSVGYYMVETPAVDIDAMFA
jgi:phage terminase large subunit-like protein